MKKIKKIYLAHDTQYHQFYFITDKGGIYRRYAHAKNVEEAYKIYLWGSNHTKGSLSTLSLFGNIHSVKIMEITDIEQIDKMILVSKLCQ